MFLCQAPKTPVNLSAQGGNNENIREKESPVSAGAKQRKDMIKMEPHDGEFLSHAVIDSVRNQILSAYICRVSSGCLNRYRQALPLCWLRIT